MGGAFEGSGREMARVSWLLALKGGEAGVELLELGAGGEGLFVLLAEGGEAVLRGEVALAGGLFGSAEVFERGGGGGGGRG